MSPRMGKRKRQIAPRKPSPPLTEVQKAREHLLIDLGVTKAEIARAIGESTRSNVTAIFRDKFRSLGVLGLEHRIVNYLRTIAATRPSSVKSIDLITLDALGWSEPRTNETPANGESSVAGET